MDSDIEIGLFLAAMNGDFEDLKRRIEEGANINWRSVIGSTALIAASSKGHFEIVKYLLESKADVDVLDNLGFSAFISACENKHKEIASLLLLYDANPSFVLYESKQSKWPGKNADFFANQQHYIYDTLEDMVRLFPEREEIFRKFHLDIEEQTPEVQINKRWNLNDIIMEAYRRSPYSLDRLFFCALYVYDNKEKNIFSKMKVFFRKDFFFEELMRYVHNSDLFITEEVIPFLFEK